MTGFWIAIGVFIVFVLVMGIRYDRRQRGMGGTGGRRSRWQANRPPDQGRRMGWSRLLASAGHPAVVQSVTQPA